MGRWRDDVLRCLILSATQIYSLWEETSLEEEEKKLFSISSSFFVIWVYQPFKLPLSESTEITFVLESSRYRSLENWSKIERWTDLYLNYLSRLDVLADARPRCCNFCIRQCWLDRCTRLDFDFPGAAHLHITHTTQQCWLIIILVKT